MTHAAPLCLFIPISFFPNPLCDVEACIALSCLYARPSPPLLSTPSHVL